MQLKPVLDKVVIKAIEAEETTKGGLILSSASQEKPQICEVIAVGPGGMIDGKEVPMFVKKGQKVIAAKYAGLDNTPANETYTIISQSDILAIVE